LTLVSFQEGYVMTPKMKIDHARNKIEDVQNETNVIKQHCIQNQNKNVQLLDERNKQIVELNTMRECKYLIIINK